MLPAFLGDPQSGTFCVDVLGNCALRMKKKATPAPPNRRATPLTIPARAAVDSPAPTPAAAAGEGGTWQASLEVLPEGEVVPRGQRTQESTVVPPFKLYSPAGHVKGVGARHWPFMQAVTG